MRRRKSRVGKFICYSEFCDSWFLISIYLLIHKIKRAGISKIFPSFLTLFIYIVPTTPYSYYLLALHFRIGWIPSVCFFSIFFLSFFFQEIIKKPKKTRIIQQCNPVNKCSIQTAFAKKTHRKITLRRESSCCCCL